MAGFVEYQCSIGQQGRIQQFVWLVSIKINLSNNKINLGNWCWINVHAPAYLPAMFPAPSIIRGQTKVTDWIIKLLDCVTGCFFSTMAETRKLLSNILWRVDIAEDKRKFSLLETSAASSAITENILVCLTSAILRWFCRNYRCLPEVSFDWTRTVDLSSRRFQ